MNEKDYRADSADSYSTIKDFIKDRKKYYRKYILGEVVEDEESDSMVLGSLVHVLLSEPDSVSDLYQIAMNNKPTGQMRLFTEALYKVTLESMDMGGTVTRSMSDMMLDAFNAVKFDKDGNEVAFKGKELSHAIAKFTGTNCEEYYNQLRLSSSKTIINPSDLENADKIAEGLKNSFNTKSIINRRSTEDTDVYWEFSIFFQMNGHPFKARIDKLIVDHKRKVISPYDLKITWLVEDFDSNFRKLMYFIQVASYTAAVANWAIDNKYDTYTIEPLKFIVADSINYMNPLIYTSTEEHYMKGLNGYVDMYGKFHPGILKALDDIAWHKESDIWNISKDNYENGGIVILKPLV